eukprot:7286913-Lingulodinium_polyedra.AAC.1
MASCWALPETASSDWSETPASPSRLSIASGGHHFGPVMHGPKRGRSLGGLACLGRGAGQRA